MELVEIYGGYYTTSQGAKPSENVGWKQGPHLDSPSKRRAQPRDEEGTFVNFGFQVTNSEVILAN